MTWRAQERADGLYFVQEPATDRAPRKGPYRALSREDVAAMLRELNNGRDE